MVVLLLLLLDSWKIRESTCVCERYPNPLPLGREGAVQRKRGSPQQSEALCVRLVLGVLRFLLTTQQPGRRGPPSSAPPQLCQVAVESPMVETDLYHTACMINEYVRTYKRLCM